MITVAEEPPAPEMKEKPLPRPGEFELDFERKGGWAETPSSLPQQSIELSVGVGPALQLDIPEPEPIPVPFASAKSFLVHFERFLKRGEVYITSRPAPAPGTTVALLLQVPDGAAPLAARAETVREVHPPEVPVVGWIAAFIDPDGTIAERLTTASFVAAF